MTTDLLHRRQTLLGSRTATFYQDPVHIVRGEGCYLFDADGRRFLDLYNNVPSCGHAHPRITAAVSQQASTLNVHSRYLHDGILDYAERLTGRHAPQISTVVFTCSGTEANEVALMMARAFTGGRGIISTNACYHGNSAEVSKLSPRHGLPHPEFRFIPQPQRYRPILETEDEDALTDAYLARLQAEIDAFAADGIPFAGLLLCPLLANEGLPDIPRRFMARAGELVRAHGGVFICDEVQAGFGRSGRWWGYQTSAASPDIVTMGKPMGNGVPLAAAAASQAIVDRFRERTRYFNTFASSPLQAAVGSAVLDVIEEEGLVENSAAVGQFLLEGLRDIQTRCEAIGEVRGRGLYLAAEWVSDREARTPDPHGADRIVNRLREDGFLIGRAGEHSNALKVRPPLVCTQAQAADFLQAFEAAVTQAQ